MAAGKWLFLLVLLAGAVKSYSARLHGGREKKGEEAEPVLSLFNLRDSNKFWNNDVLLKRLEEWKKPARFYAGNTELDYYIQQGNVASYLDLEHVDAIYIPVPLNFIFIGFSGTGNHGLRLGEEELKRWFEHIDHVQEHTRVPLHWELENAEQQSHPLPLVSHVHYNYTVHALEMGQKVAAIFETAIRVLGRPEDPLHPEPQGDTWHQVDMRGMSDMVSSLLRHLDLDNSSYNVVVLNPSKERALGRYGYRLGVSEAEMALMLQNDKRKKELLSPHLEKAHRSLDMEATPEPLFDKRPDHKFAWKDVQHHETAQWTSSWEKLLDGWEARLQEIASPTDRVFAVMQQSLTSKREAKAGAALKRALRDGAGAGWEPDCLVDTFVGPGRWALVDLSAGPFSWGPLVGGEGVRTEASLPSVEKYFKDVNLGALEHTDEELEKELETMAEERFERVDEDSAHEVDMLLAEMDVYEAFAQRHCGDKRRNIPLCRELRDRLDDMKEDFAKHAESTGDPMRGMHARDALRKMEQWGLAGGLQGGTGGEKHNISRAWDMFLAETGSMLSGAMRHVITPSTSSGAYRFHARVSFHIYLITQQTYYARSRTAFDVTDLQDELAALRLPSQQFQFTKHKLSLAEDPALAMAYAGALRSAAVTASSAANESAVVAPTQRTYLDSAHLQHQLQLLPVASSSPRKGQPPRSAPGSAVLEVPIFIFAVSNGPVLIDESFAAKGLSDMVLAVQLEDARWPTELQCTGRPLHADLTNPTKEVVAATLHHLAGVLPAHLAYSPSHGSVDQDWRWSAGAHPLSATSRSHRLGALQADAAARNFVVTALDESVREVNDGIALLAHEATHEETYRNLKAHREQHLVADYNEVIATWQQIASLLEELDFGGATKLLEQLGERSRSFYQYARQTVEALHPLRCTRRRRLQLGFIPASALACAILGLLLLALFRPRRNKPKIN